MAPANETNGRLTKFRPGHGSFSLDSSSIPVVKKIELFQSLKIQLLLMSSAFNPNFPLSGTARHVYTLGVIIQCFCLEGERYERPG
jgi:hypothetical protein